jgi:tetratricopeptide (TPR) repeat protein
MDSSGRFDRILLWSVAGLAVAVIAVGGYFGWTVYRDKIAQEDANPQMRIANVIHAQIVKAPNDPILRVRYGEALAAAGRTQQAIDQFNAALKIDPKHTGALIDLGQVAIASNNMDGAITYFQKVISLTASGDYQGINDRRETAYYELGRIAMYRKQYDQAIGYFKEALRIRSDAADTYYYLATALDAAGQQDDAIKQLQTAVAFDTKFSQARYYLGQLYMKRGDRVSASEQFHLAAVADPKAAEPKQALAQFGTSSALLKQAESLTTSDPQGALNAILIARNIDPTNVAVQKLYAKLLLDKGDKVDALEAYKEAQKLAPKDAEISKAIAALTPASASKSKKKTK